MPSIHISLAAETLFTIIGIPVTNSLLTTWIVMILLIVMSLNLSAKLKIRPGSFQLIMELLIGGIYGLFAEILFEKNKIYFPFLATVFIFIISLNWFSLLPGVGPIGLRKSGEAHSRATVFAAENAQRVQTPAKSEEENEFIPLLRAGTADLNTTFALALLTVGYIQYAGFTTLGKEYLKRFVNISNPINFVVGILEIVSEFSRIISFAFRLFGNIFAGEVLLTVIAFLIPLFAPIPFLGLEIFVGFIQALVFAMLAAVFFSMATSHQEH